jgi:hypothetical protein
MSIIWKIYPAHFFKSRNAPIFNTSRLHVHHFLTWKRKCLPLIKHVTFWHHAFNSQHFSLVLGLTNLNAAHGFPQELICRRQTKHSTHNLTRSWERERLLGRIASPKKTTVNNMNIYIYIYIYRQWDYSLRNIDLPLDFGHSCELGNLWESLFCYYIV